MLPQIVEETAEFTFQRMYFNAPWRTGNLAMSITKQVTGNKATVTPTADYAIYVIKGTAPHEIYPIGASCLAFEWGMLGGMAFYAHVHHPGTQPNPFIETTATEARDEALRIAKKVIDESVGKYQE